MHFEEQEAPFPKSPAVQSCSGVLYAFVHEEVKPLIGWKSARLRAVDSVTRWKWMRTRRVEIVGERIMRWIKLNRPAAVENCFPCS